ncbi:MAG: aminodeoxychorismate/anthranilate synthase component II [Campylobacterales bacterium]
MLLMIDNYDSFTYNVVQYCWELGANLKVIRNDQLSVEEILALKPEKIIISPGPSTPREAGVSVEVVRKFQGPLLGICLGHQSIAFGFGGEIVEAPRVMHGKVSEIEIIDPEDPLFRGLPTKYQVTRYHSLVVAPETLPANIKVTAYSTDDSQIMALRVEGRPIFGVQFHPESIMTQYGKELLSNFLSL